MRLHAATFPGGAGERGAAGHGSHGETWLMTRRARDYYRSSPES